MAAAAGEIARLSTGAEMRLSGRGQTVVVCVNGGQADEVEGTWSASLEWLVRRLAPRFRTSLFAEVRYRIKSWRHLSACVDDARAAVQAVGAQRTLLLGFSMGGAVAISAADEPSVERVLGLAPWIPDRLSLEPLRGKRLDVAPRLARPLAARHPGRVARVVAARLRACARARRRGQLRADPGRAARDRAARAPGTPVPLPRAAAWERRVAAQLAAL